MAEPPLSGRIALVTGAGVRVGRAIAWRLAEAGADVAVHYLDSRVAAGDLAARIRASGRRAAALRADLGVPSDCRRLIRRCVETFGGIDFLVHSAANFHRVPFAETDEKVWESAMSVNARSGLLLAREAAPELRERRGRVVLISDRMAMHPPRHYLAHSVSKAAVEGLVRALAVELAPEVSVNGIAPGAVLVPEGTPPEQAERWARQVPLQRLGEPEEVAEAVLFLCSGPSFLTGEILRMDGGQSLP